MHPKFSNKRIVFRTDGSNTLGLGHLVRCIALAEMLCELFDIVFICSEIPESMIKNIKQKGWLFIPISEENLITQFLLPNDILISDGYQFNQSYFDLVRSYVHKSVYIDDFYNSFSGVDLIINHAADATKQRYENTNNCLYALGLGYALLRPPFFKKKNVARIPDSLFICLGGSDSKYLTGLILQQAINSNFFSKIVVVTGAAFNHQNELTHLVSKSKNVIYLQNLSADEMSDCLQSSEFAFVSASGIAYEALYSGCKLLTGWYAENQIDFNKGLEVKNYAHTCNQINESSVIKLFGSISNFKWLFPDLKLEETPQRFKNLFLIISSNLRRAELSDAELYFNWANDPLVRNNAFHKEPIEWKSHLNWFGGKLSQMKSELYVLELNNKNIGQIRIDCDHDNIYWIDYSIDEKYRGMGFGKIILDKLIEKVNGYELAGKVFESNKPSAKAFETVGFILAENKDGILTYKFQNERH